MSEPWPEQRQPLCSAEFMASSSSTSSEGVRRLGMLQCPNAGSIGWQSSDETVSNTSGIIEAKNVISINDTRTAFLSTHVAGISTIPNSKLQLDENSCVTINVKNQNASEKSTGFTLPCAEHLSSDMSSLTPLKPEQSFPMVSLDPPSMIQKQEEMKSLGRKRPRIAEAHNPLCTNSLENDMSTKVPSVMIHPNFEAPRLLEDEISTTDTLDTHLPLFVSLEYESKNINKDNPGAQILTVHFFPERYFHTAGNHPSPILLGYVSGKVRIELISPLLTSHGENNGVHDDEENKLDCKHHPHSLVLDFFGYRLSQHSEYKSFVIHRPEWMKMLPITLAHPNIADLKNQPSPITVKARITSVDDNVEEKKVDHHYGACLDDSYQLKILPPKAFNPIYDGFLSLQKRYGGITVPKSWTTTVDNIVDSLHPTNSSPPTTESVINLPHICPRILICGAKGVGKSTFLRYLTNRMLSLSASRIGGHIRRVAILDLDAGQPELSPPGLLTLTIVTRPIFADPPGHMICDGGRLKQESERQTEECGTAERVVSSYFYGDVTSKSDPDMFVHLGSLLMEKYKELVQQEEEIFMNDNNTRMELRQKHNILPLLVNTEGWVKGLGYEILSAIIGIVNPSHIVQILGNSKAKSFDLSFPKEEDDIKPSQRSVHVIQSFDDSACDECLGDRPSSSTSALLPTASNHRAHRLCAYFLGGYSKMTRLHSVIVGEETSVTFQKERGLVDPNNIIGLTISSMLPYAVPFHSVQVYPSPGLWETVTEVKPPWGIRGDLASIQVLDSLTASIVGLCSNPETSTTSIKAYWKAGTSMPVLPCVGLGIIRSVDHINRIFYVLTPVHSMLLSHVTCFVGGNISLPLECIVHGVHSESFAFLSFCQPLINPNLGLDVIKSRNV